MVWIAYKANNLSIAINPNPNQGEINDSAPVSGASTPVAMEDGAGPKAPSETESDSRPVVVDSSGGGDELNDTRDGACLPSGCQGTVRLRIPSGTAEDWEISYFQEHVRRLASRYDVKPEALALCEFTRVAIEGCSYRP